MSTEETSNREESIKDTDQSENLLGSAEPSENLKWYTVYVQSGSEAKALENLRARIKKEGLENFFGEYLVPKIIKQDDSKKTERKIMPGYIFIQMVLNEKTWELVRKTPKISGFIGHFLNPPPVPEHEIQHLKDLQRLGGELKILKFDLAEGDVVNIIDGPFKDFSGKIIAIDKERAKLTVEISIFGRQTPVSVDFVQVVKK